MSNIEDVLLNKEKFFIGIIKSIVKNGYIIDISGNSVFINDNRGFDIGTSVLIGENNGKYIILNTYKQTPKNVKSVKIT